MKTVLLAYERDQDLAAVESVLQARGHRIVKARSGLEALEAIRSERPDAVVSDVLLPRLDGFALCRRLREDPSYLHLPFILHSFRVEGPKYEAFAAEVGAQRFLPRGSVLEDLVAILDESTQGSGTMRMPALLPELLDRREQDRRRLHDLELRLREVEATNQQLAVAERVARERAEQEARARAEFAATESLRIRELQMRIKELEHVQRQAVEAESQARGAAEESRQDAARLAALESRLGDLQATRARAQAVAADLERVFAAQPVPTWIVDMESRVVHAASDAAAALVGVEPRALVGRTLDELLPGVDLTVGDSRQATIAWKRQDGSDAQLELRRHATSFAGRGCWLVTARDVTSELALEARERAAALRAAALDTAPEPCALLDDEGRFVFANRAMLALLGIEADAAAGLTIGGLSHEPAGDDTVRARLDGPIRQAARWRRPDGAVLDVELSIARGDDADAPRVLTVRDVSSELRHAARNERDRERVSRLLELVQRAHSMTESEMLDRTLQLAQDLTGSPRACLFLPVGDATALELAARRETDVPSETVSALARWRGPPPPETALAECVGTQRPVVREATEGTGVLRQAGLPGALHRQIVTPLLEGGRLLGALLVADAPQAYDDDHRRHLAQVAETTARLLRRRRSDAEVISAMDHMERVMLGAIESLAQLAEAQDACKTGRARRIAEYAAGIGLELGLPGHTLRGLRVMGQLIDVGMLQIPRELLWRPGVLSASEFELIKTHAERGYESLRHIEFPWPVAEVVRQHHERLDGSGYPRGLKGEEILLEARIVAVADAVEAMLAQRPHRPALSVAACIEELQSQAGRRYDARVVKACVKLLRDGQPSPAAAGTASRQDEAVVDQRIA
jgi:PAS domain S-box-containing protein